MNEAFAQAVQKGLSQHAKQLPSSYFYDAEGDRLFQKIMQLPEYYLTNAEMEVFSQKTQALHQSLQHHEPYFLVELGAGDGSKTLHLLRSVDPQLCTYLPIDISGNVLRILTGNVQKAAPQLAIKAMTGDYFNILETLPQDQPKSLLFMGSNLGNMPDDKAQQFLKMLGKYMLPGDKLLLGLDLIKPKEEVLLPLLSNASMFLERFD